MRGKTEASVEKRLKQKRQARSLLINESFTNIKTVKLFGWESNFQSKVDNIFQEELTIEDEADFRGMFYNFAEDILQVSMSFAVFSVYTWYGNQLTLSKLIVTELMLQ